MRTPVAAGIALVAGIGIGVLVGYTPMIDPDEYLAENIFWVPKEARWSYLQANAKLPTIGKLIDDLMQAIEASNESLKGVLPKDYTLCCANIESSTGERKRTF